MSDETIEDPGAVSRGKRFDAFAEAALAEPHRETDKLVFRFAGKKPVETSNVEFARSMFIATGANIESDWTRPPRYIERSGDREDGWCAKATRGHIDLRRDGEKVVTVTEDEFLELLLVLIEARAYAVSREPVPPAREVLFQLLDDIDTLDDACRDDDAAFREQVRAIQKKRFDLVEPVGDHPLRWREDQLPEDED